MLKEQGIALGPSMWELPGWWGVLPLTLVPSSSPHLPNLPSKETMQINHFCLGVSSTTPPAAPG